MSSLWPCVRWSWGSSFKLHPNWARAQSLGKFQLPPVVLLIGWWLFFLCAFLRPAGSSFCLCWARDRFRSLPLPLSLNKSRALASGRKSWTCPNWNLQEPPNKTLFEFKLSPELTRSANLVPLVSYVMGIRRQKKHPRQGFEILFAQDASMLITLDHSRKLSSRFRV